jgi:hypothetical protein
VEMNQYSRELAEKSGCENVFLQSRHFITTILLRGQRTSSSFWRAKSEEETYRGEELVNGI